METVDSQQLSVLLPSGCRTGVYKILADPKDWSTPVIEEEDSIRGEDKRR